MEDSEKISGDNGAGCATLQMCLVPTIYVRGSAVVSVPNPVLDILTEKARRTGENVLTTKRPGCAGAGPVPAVPALAR